MTTAYTSLLGLALPVTGELSGTWGNTVNTEITALLDSAIAGTTTISADADITLTTTTGASNESREAIILWTAGGTATRNITAPAQSKTYVVINKSSSTQSIVLRGAGPTTGVTIVKDEKAVCAWNGSDFVKIANTSGAGVFTTLSATGVATFSAGTAALPAITTTGDTNTGIFFPAADTIAFSEGGAEAMRIDSSGNVGIGGVPTQKLDVYGGAGAAVSIVRAAAGQNAFFSIGGNGNSFLSTSFDIIQDSANLAQIAQRANAAMSFSTNNTERMRIDSSGNLLVGGASIPGSGNVRSSIGAGLYCFTAYQSGTTAFTAFQVVNGNGEIGSITTSATTTSYNTSSDYRLKEEIAPMTGALAKVAALKPCTYKWKVDGSEGQGFIAHELDEVVSGCVTGEKDAVDANGNPKYQGIDTSFLVATLTAAIQEQQALITSLTARVAALEAN